MIGKVISGVLCALCLCTVGVAQTAYESIRTDRASAYQL